RVKVAVRPSAGLVRAVGTYRPRAIQISATVGLASAAARAASRLVKASAQERPVLAPAAAWLTYRRAMSQGLPTPLLSWSPWSGLKAIGQLSQASPKPSPSESVCWALETSGQLSISSGTPSPSVSVGGGAPS